MKEKINMENKEKMQKNQSVIRINKLRKVYKLEDESVIALHSVSAEI